MNGDSVHGLSHDEAIAIFKRIRSGPVALQLGRRGGGNPGNPGNPGRPGRPGRPGGGGLNSSGGSSHDGGSSTRSGWVVARRFD